MKTTVITLSYKDTHANLEFIFQDGDTLVQALKQTADLLLQAREDMLVEVVKRTGKPTES